MNCRQLEADVVDLARGAELGAGAEPRVRAHLDQCAGCAARFAREQQLTAALKALAETVPSLSGAAAVEARLLRAFAEQQAAAPPRPATTRSMFAAPSARAWLAAAAVLVLAVAAWQGAARWRSANEAVPAPVRFTAAVAAAPAPAVATASSAPTAGAPPAASPPAVRASARSSIPSRPRVAPQGDDGVLRFVTLPTAIGLPAIESGRIVRVGVPVAMLPAYGLDVMPDPGAQMVEADVLVGQDGQPRAIRFVTLDPDSRRRQ